MQDKKHWERVYETKARCRCCARPISRGCIGIGGATSVASTAASRPTPNATPPRGARRSVQNAGFRSAVVTFRIEPLTEAHFAQLHQVADQVARERRYLAMFQAPPAEAAFAFYRSVLDEGQCHVAVADEQVVGWCDILPQFGESRRHVGTLGIGLLPALRDRGLGARLMDAAIALAWARGLSRIELTVRTDNRRAKALYERLGFVDEGLKKHFMRIDGHYLDCFSMALLRDDDRPVLEVRDGDAAGRA